MKPRIRKPHPFPWIIESLEEDASFEDRSMFGCRATYFRGQLVLVCADQEEPWNGLLLVTSREHHLALQAEFPSLTPHAVLGKWLYISQGHPDFEEIAPAIVSHIKKGDERIGIEPKPRKQKRRAR